MSFSVGDLVAHLRADTKQFDASMAKAEQSFQKVGAAAGKVDTGVQRATGRISAYTNVQRLSTAEVQAATRAYGGQAKASGVMTAARAAMIRADERWIRAQGLMHVEALRMNAAFDAGAVVSTRSVAGLTRMNGALSSIASRMLGVSPVFGSLVRQMGSFAMGGLVITGVLAGLAAIAAAWRLIGRDAKEAEERLKAAQDRLEAIALAQKNEAIGGQTGVDVRLNVQEINRLRARNAALERIVPGGVERPGFATEAREYRNNAAEVIRLQGLIAAGEVAIAEAAEKAADKGATSWDKLVEALRKYNAELLRTMNATSVFVERGMGISAESEAAWRTRNANVQRGAGLRYNPSPARPFNANDHDLQYFSDGLKKGASHLEKFGAGVKSAGEGLFSMEGLGANLASQGIGMVLGAITDSLFGPRYVTALEDNTQALKNMSGATLRNLEAAYERANGLTKLSMGLAIDALGRGGLATDLSLARRGMEAGDVTDPAGQFAVLKQVLGGSVAGFGGLTMDNIDEQLQGILAQIAAGTFNPDVLGKIPLEDFLNILAEMESLGDAAGDAAGEISGLTSAVRNAPSGYKVNFQRHQADTGVATGGGTTTGDNITIEGDVVIVTNDPEEFGRELVRQRRRGGVTNYQLATQGMV